MGRPFVKMHGLRNHFVIVDGREEPYRPTTAEIVRICDVECGVGADQLVVLEQPPAGSAAVAFVRFYNVDGGEAEACGNATRCVSWLLMEEAGVDDVVVETLAGELACERVGDLTVRCGMGQVSMDWAKIPLAEARDTCHVPVGNGPLEDAVALSIGNPHVVYFVDDVDSIDLPALAPAIQSNPLFPNGVNVGVARLVSDSFLELSVYERGAGLTTACGSGACVAVYAALARGLTDSRSMTVEMPAGAVKVDIDGQGRATMTGPVAHSFRGELLGTDPN